MHKEQMGDIQLLKRLTAHEDEILDEDTVEAFRGMLHGLEHGHSITSKQRGWALSVYEAKDIQRHYAENLVSRGCVPKTKNVPVFEWEKPENRPLKPPGR